jgi:hypothetical protein
MIYVKNTFGLSVYTKKDVFPVSLSRVLNRIFEPSRQKLTEHCPMGRWALMMKAVRPFGTSFVIYQSTWRKVPGDSHLYICLFEDMKFHQVTVCWKEIHNYELHNCCCAINICLFNADENA